MAAGLPSGEVPDHKSSMAVKAVVVFAEEVENRGMATEYIGLPGELVAKVKEAAAREEITPEELVRDAVENRLSRAEWRKTIEFGHRNARERGSRTCRTLTLSAAHHSGYKCHSLCPELSG